MYPTSPRRPRAAPVAPLRLLAAMLMLACKGTEPPHAEALALLGNPPAAAQSGVPFTTSFIVEVRDGSGSPFAQEGLAVTAALVGQGGALGGTTTRSTDATGHATFSDLAITGLVGTYTLRFSANGLSAAVSSPLTLAAGPAAQIGATSASALQGTVGTAVAPLPSVTVTDASGNPVAGAAVTFSTVGGGTLTGGTQTTNATGVATLGGWTLPTTTGQYTVTATAAGAAGAPVSFVVTAGPDAPSTMQPTGGGQSVLYGSRLPTPLQVRVVDQYGNPTPGVVVTWGTFAGAGTAEPINVATDVDGVVRSNYRLGTMPGQNVIRASITSRGLTTDFTATALGFSDQIAVAVSNSCALDESGAAYCWGENRNGALGDGTRTNRTVPTLVSGGLRFKRISTGGGTTCAVAVDGVPYCWGYNSYGAVGDGTTTDKLVPTPVTGGTSFSQVQTSGTVTCAASFYASYCWGSNINGQLGVGTASVPTCTAVDATVDFPCSPVPMLVPGPPTSAISVSTSHVCAVAFGSAMAPSGELWCWGAGGGWGSSGTQTQPVRAVAGLVFTEVAIGDGFTCGIADSFSSYCWGTGSRGELGTGTIPDTRAAPFLLPGFATRHIAAGPLGACAAVVDGRALCWGFNESGAVGDGTTTNRGAPTAAATGESFLAVAASGDHSCGRTINGQLLCWGNNAFGQLGNGSADLRALVPILVRP